MKKILIILVAILVTTCTIGNAFTLTNATNGINAELIVKYDDEISAPILFENKTINIAITIKKSDIALNIAETKLFISLFDNKKLSAISSVAGTENASEYHFQIAMDLPSDLTHKSLKLYLWEDNLKPVSNSLILLDVLRPIVYNYDNNNRLTSIEYGDKMLTYTYDNRGNLLNRTISIVEKTIQPAMLKPIIEETQDIESNIPTNPQQNEEENTERTPIKNYLVADPAWAVTTIIDGVVITTYNLSLMPPEFFGALEESE